jgi:3',5'-cyclic-AMP phosphodiesterase
MPRVLWLTDLHLNFLTECDRDEWLAWLARQEASAAIISGDIGEALDLIEQLRAIARSIAAPTYFVLGNHDFYLGQIQQVRRCVRLFCANHATLRYLTVGEAHELAPGVGIVGHDGWADARLGSYDHSLVQLNDFRLIQDLIPLSTADRKRMLAMLGDLAATHFRRVLPPALDRWPHVFAVTHVPPWREACWHCGQPSDDEWLPFFTCKAVGDALVEIMRSRPNRQLTVLCGHTHSSGECENLRVLTGRAEYGAPEVQAVFEL